MSSIVVRQAHSRQPGIIKRTVAAMFGLRFYDAATSSRRTDGWRKANVDSRVVTSSTLSQIITQSRDLTRNNGWVRRSQKTIVGNTIGRGIRPRVSDPRLAAQWKLWAANCDATGRLGFYGIQRLVMRAVVRDGGSLVVRRRGDDMFPFKIEVLEIDYIDRSKNEGSTVQGIVFDETGARVGYWLYSSHPGGSASSSSSLVPASDVLHIYDQERPGQIHGVPWCAPAIVRIRDFHEYEDATLMRQKIAACYSAFVRNTDGSGGDDGDDDLMMLEPGRIEYLRAGEEVTFADPPNVADNDAFSRTQHHAIAVELGVPYSDLTGDYREATFASLRIERLAHWGDVTTWQDDIIVPGLCDPIWKWFAFAYSVRSVETVEWFGPVMPSIDPEKEGLAVTRLIRSGMMTPDDAVESRGKDPDTHWPAYARALQRLDDLGIVLDSDPRKTTLNGQAQDTEEPKMAESDA